jgi:hypothetical protein
VAPARQPLSQDAPLSQDTACGADPVLARLAGYLTSGRHDAIIVLYARHHVVTA